MQTDNLIPTRRPDSLLINQKKRICTMNFTEQSENQIKRKERQVFELRPRTKKAVEHGGDGDTSCNWHT